MSAEALQGSSSYDSCSQWPAQSFPGTIGNHQRFYCLEGICVARVQMHVC